MGTYCLVWALLMLTAAVVGESTNIGKNGNVPSLNGKYCKS